MKLLPMALCTLFLLGPAAPGPARAGSGAAPPVRGGAEKMKITVFPGEAGPGCSTPGRGRAAADDGVCGPGQGVEGFDFGAVSGVLEEARKQAAGMTVPDGRAAGRGLAAALEARRRFLSPENQGRIEAERKRLGRMLREAAGGSGPSVPEEPAERPGRLGADERVYLFISSSVPLSTLRRYAALIDRAGDPGVVMVLRGFVGGMRKAMPTIEYLRRLLVRDPGCDPAREKCALFRAAVEIDPVLFARYRVSRVPAFLYLGREGAEPVIAYGDAALDYQLDRMSRQAGGGSLEGLIAAMRRGFYDGRKEKEEKR